MKYYISDLHFGHQNIIKLCNRPFSSVEEMNKTLIDNWNDKVSGKDTVYILGDIAWNGKLALEIIPKLKGKKILIYGNHDEHLIKHPEYQACFEKICPMMFDSDRSFPLTLCHYPLLEWKASRKENSDKLGVLIYGHIHNRVDPLYQLLYQSPNALNAGVDINGYCPVTYEEMVENNRIFRINALEQLAGQ